MSEFICADCMDYLPKYQDGYFDLAICDPPYGGGSQLMQRTHTAATEGGSEGGLTATLRTTRGGGRFDAYAKREMWKNGRDLGNEVPDERGYV